MYQIITKRKNLLTTVLLLCFGAFTSNVMAQTWQIGSPNAASVTATLSSGTLTISGTGALQNFGALSSTPWYSVKDNINSLVIQNGITSISDGAFNNCTNLKTVTIQDGTIELAFPIYGGYANMGIHFLNCPVETLYLGRNINNSYTDYQPFRENSALKTITIGQNVTAINAKSFYNCTGLQSLTLGNELTIIDDNAFFGCSSLTGALTIPNKVKTIGRGTFQGCRVLPSVTIPNSVTSIGEAAFSGCIGLKTVTIQDGTVELAFPIYGGYANMGIHFSNCPIETLYLGRNINNSYTDYQPFRENSALKTLTIGQNVTAINAKSFIGCSGLNQIHSQNPTPPNAADGCFYNVYNTCTLYVPTGSVNAYKAATEWKKFFSVVTVIDNINATQLSIFPNPVQNDLFIKSELPIKKVEIYSLAGGLTMSRNNFIGKISVSTLPKGIYLIKIYTDNGLVIRKIMKD